MAIIPINAGQTLPPHLLRRAAALPEGAPVIVMIHGYRFCPSRPEHDPHRHILGLGPVAPGARRMRSWPRALGFAEHGAEGLGLPFGWPARGSLRAAYRRAAASGADLARSLDLLSQAAQRPVHLIAHSLGARVAMQALARARPGSVGRLVLMAAAELRPQAQAAIDSPAGRRAEIINVTSRENDLFDLGLEMLVGAGRHRALGLGLAQPRGNWLDLQIDAPDVRASLTRLGFPIGQDIARACHWSPYLRDGLFEFYRVALGQPWALPLPMLRSHLPARQAPRWSRLLEMPIRRQPSSLSSA
ncbi:Alpha/beta hydrolase of unknown function [Paracoccus isoporae]|uniref:AB hydrolase-1 domain-containing protein n=1 Tax=Paracoccus isoporae TaxID=591205 RepID=A0A1G7C8R0_9RHOB|nr:alpha/beta hydrolase [Paracoccus isoporae]SDE35762.1 Alpha/beta hydrolase of unknown function [Paracoccus isoporae]